MRGNMISLKSIVKEIVDERNADRIVYVDMDGVICDFGKAFNKNASSHPKKEWWETVMMQGPKFWINMDWMPGGQLLWKYVVGNFPNVKILSAIDGPDDFSEMASEGKHKWLKSHAPSLKSDDIILVDGAHLKSKYAQSNDILIDDQFPNIEDWRHAGGIGILHRDLRITINQLHKLK